MKRFRIAEESMRPALAPGDEIVATSAVASTVGDVVVFEHPGRSGFWMVKRRVNPPAPIPVGSIWVESDNREFDTVDSRRLGPIDESGVLARITRFDETTFSEAVDLLISEDEALSALVTRHGVPEFWQRKEGFEVLVLLILEQQVSLESGAAMYHRLLEATGAVSPQAVIDLGDEGMRSIGVTRQKSGYLIGLAEAVRDGRLDLAEVGTLPVEEARMRLTDLKGIGLWTADAYLLSAVRHVDMWPTGDRALQVGTGEALGMSTVPDQAELEVLGEPWRPVRAAAARLIWHSYLTVRGREEPPDATLAQPTDSFL